MDSRNIYEKCQHLMKKVVWLKCADDESEYKYVGVGSSFAKEIAADVISSNFNDTMILMVLHRKTSMEINIKEAADLLQQHTETRNVVLTDKSFRIFVEFNTVGSYRVGHYLEPGRVPQL
ncbi:MAG TPA: hypothetical protein VFO10_29990 [Oligoflexus sp.]|uniref:hypothetical protein n=1 Tax=Oligoflexus sp. TaxID=1971216 RepID=UPI002D8064CD|nr:hypothetical protein [Oligoflexus sp.]HET9241535.1 hypothetical protein [Oligoflexus sp.]